MVLGGAAGPRAVASFLPAAGLLVARLVGARISAAATAALTAAWDRAFGDDPQKGGGQVLAIKRTKECFSHVSASSQHRPCWMRRGPTNTERVSCWPPTRFPPGSPFRQGPAREVAAPRPPLANTAGGRPPRRSLGQTAHTREG